MNDRSRVQAALAEAGVAGVHDFGRFVSNTKYFEPSSFDERAAMPVLLTVLPTLTDPKVVGGSRWAVASSVGETDRLRRPLGGLSFLGLARTDGCGLAAG